MARSAGTWAFAAQLAGPGLVNYPWAKTGNYYAGPGTSVRACVLTPATVSFPAETVCSSSSVALPASTAAPADDGTSVFYDHNDLDASTGSGDLMCLASLNSSGTLDKTASSEASMTLDGTGELARACVQSGTQAAVCTTAW